MDGDKVRVKLNNYTVAVFEQISSWSEHYEKVGRWLFKSEFSSSLLATLSFLYLVWLLSMCTSPISCLMEIENSPHYAFLLNCSVKTMCRVTRLSPYSVRWDVLLFKMTENNGRVHRMFKLIAEECEFCGQTSWIWLSFPPSRIILGRIANLLAFPASSLKCCY